MSDEEEFRFKCVRCGKCCIDKATIVNVTYKDILRIKNGLGLNLDELNHILAFYIFDKQPTEEDKKKMVVSPVETERGKAFVGLKKNPEGKCYFYEEEKNKCMIYNARPMFCRTFPFSFKVSDKALKEEKEDEDQDLKRLVEIKYTSKAKEYCQGIGEDAPVINKDKWLDLGKKTIEDLNKNYYVVKKWNEAVQNNEIKPSVKMFLKKILSIKEG
jgi:Fe-S-cluster containining protein